MMTSFVSNNTSTTSACLVNRFSREKIALCQTKEDIEVLKKMGRPIVEIKEMKNEESVVCSLTGSPSDYNENY